MPWTYPDNVPPVAINWSVDEQRRCVAAANSTLEETGDEEQAIFACISAAGHSEEGAWRTNMERKTVPMIVTKIEPQGIVEHAIAVMGNVDLGGDKIWPGAFTKTINERMGKIRVLDSHQASSIMNIIGRPMQMWEIGKNQLPSAIASAFPEATGALMTKTQFLMDTPEGYGAFIRIRDGAVSEYSIGYDALDVDFTREAVGEKDVNVRNLRTVKLWEYGPVVFAMNPATATVSAKRQEGDLGDKAVSGATNLPLASREREWDASAAQRRVRAWADAEDEPNAKYRRAFFWYDAEAADQFGSYKLQFADVIGGTLTAVPRGIFAVSGALEGARGGGVDISESDKAAVRTRVSGYYAKMREEFDDDSIVPPWDKASVRPVQNKARNLGRLVNELYGAFYRQYPDSNYTVYWIKEVWDEYLIVSEESPTGNKTWQIGFTADENSITFVPMAEWVQVEVVYVPVPKASESGTQTKIGRVISKATATRMRSAMNGMQSALTELINLLADAGIVDEDDSDDEDEDDKGAPATGQVAKKSQSQDNVQAGPDAEPPTSKDKMLALIDAMDSQLSLLEV